MSDAPMSTADTSCPDCHAVVTDLAAHERWHTRLVADVAKAVSQALDRAEGSRVHDVTSRSV
jgi:hypothetical protein